MLSQWITKVELWVKQSLFHQSTPTLHKNSNVVTLPLLVQKCNCVTLQLQLIKCNVKSLRYSYFHILANLTKLSNHSSTVAVWCGYKRLLKFLLWFFCPNWCIKRAFFSFSISFCQKSNENITQAVPVTITEKLLFWRGNDVTAKITQNVTITVMRYMQRC